MATIKMVLALAYIVAIIVLALKGKKMVATILTVVGIAIAVGSLIQLVTDEEFASKAVETIIAWIFSLFKIG